MTGSDSGETLVGQGREKFPETPFYLVWKNGLCTVTREGRWWNHWKKSPKILGGRSSRKSWDFSVWTIEVHWTCAESSIKYHCEQSNFAALNRIGLYAPDCRVWIIYQNQELLLRYTRSIFISIALPRIEIRFVRLTTVQKLNELAYVHSFLNSLKQRCLFAQMRLYFTSFAWLNYRTSQNELDPDCNVGFSCRNIYGTLSSCSA